MKVLMLSLTYQSEASFAFTEDDLSVLLLNSRSTNRRHGLTGLLLHRDGQFVQALEGPDRAVRERFDVIAADPRHRNVRILSEVRDGQRQFPDWTMGFRTVVGSFDDHLPGFAPVYDAPTST